MTVTPVESLISATGADFGARSKSFFLKELFILNSYRAEFWHGLGIFKNLKLLLKEFFKNQFMEDFYLVTQHQFSTKMPGI